MTALSPDSIGAFLNRFYLCGDSIIRQFQVTYSYRGGTAKANILLSVQDKDESTNDGWVNLMIEIEDVTEFSWYEGHNVSYQILTSDLHIAYLMDQFFLDFGGLVDAPKIVEEFRASKVYIAGKHLAWVVLPYQE